MSQRHWPVSLSLICCTDISIVPWLYSLSMNSLRVLYPVCLQWDFLNIITRMQNSNTNTQEWSHLITVTPPLILCHLIASWHTVVLIVTCHWGWSQPSLSLSSHHLVIVITCLFGAKAKSSSFIILPSLSPLPVIICCHLLLLFFIHFCCRHHLLCQTFASQSSMRATTLNGLYICVLHWWGRIYGE